MRSKLKKIGVITGIILLAVLALGLIIRAMGNYITGQQLEKQLKAMKAQGFLLSHRDFEPECSDKDNAALIWKGAEAMFELAGDEKALLNNTSVNLFYDRPIDSESRERLRDLINRNQSALRLIQEAAEKPCFKYDNDWNCHAWEIQLPNAVKIIQALRLLGIDSVLKADNGQVEEAVDQCIRGIHFGRRYLDEPFLLSYLLSMSNMQIHVSFLNNIISGRDINPDTLSQIMQELDLKAWCTGFENSLRSELTYTIDAGMSVVSGNTPRQGFGFWEKKSLWLLRPLVKRDLRIGLLSWQKILSMPLFPYYTTRETREMIETYSNKLKSPHIIDEYIFPNLTVTLFKQGRLEAKMLTAQIGISAKIFHSREGRYPEKISDLVPDFFEKEPVDPFTGKPFIYRRQETGFIIYSLGSNLKDDGGRELFQPTQLIADKDDDLTWKEKALKK